MEVGIHLKSPEGPKLLGHYDFEDAELERLHSEFEEFLKTNTPGGRSYSCKINGEPHKIFVRFSEIAFIG